MRLLVFMVLAASASSFVASQSQEGNQRPRTRGLIPDLNFRSGGSRRLSNFRAGVQKIASESNETVSKEPVVISEPQPGQEFVSYVNSRVRPQQKPKNEILLITEPIPGQEFVSFSSKPEPVQDSVVSAKDGQLFYINLDRASTPPTQDTTYEPFNNFEHSATTSSSINNDEYYSTSFYDDITTQSPSSNVYLPNKNIEILTSNGNHDIKGTAVNELYGKFFDESDLLSNDEKELFPAESKVKSKFEIKEVNGQLYEYEYRYYYDDELPEYDYDVVGNIPDLNATQPSEAIDLPSTSTTTTLPPTISTAATTTAPPPPPTTASPVATRTRTSSRDSSTFTRSRSRNTVARQPQVQENNIVPQVQNSRGRSRGQALTRPPPPLPSQGVPVRTSSRAIQNRVNQNTINTVDVGAARLPTQTRFPPRARVTTVAPEPESFGVALSETSYLPTASPNEIAQETTSTFDPFEEQSTTLSPATRSLMNLYALSVAAEAGETEVSSVQPDLFDQETEKPFDYLDAYYDYDYSSSSFSPFSVADSTQSPEYIDSISTEQSTTPSTTTTTTTTTTTPEPTTTTTTTTEAPSTRSRTRGSFRNSLGGGRRRFPSRASSRQSTTEEASTLETTTEAVVQIGSSRTSSLGSRPINSSFRPSRNRFNRRRNEGTTSTTTTLDSSTTTESSNIPAESAAPPAPPRNRFSRPRLSFKSRSKPNSKQSTTTTAAAAAAAVDESTTASSISGRGRLFSNRFSRRRQSGRQKSSTPSASADSESDITSDDTASTDTKDESSVTPSSTSATTAATRPSRTRSFGRPRFRRPSRLGVQTEAPKDQESTDNTASELEVKQEDLVVQEASPEVAPQPESTSPARRPSRTRASSRLSSLRNSRGRGRGRGRTSDASTSTTTQSPQLEDGNESLTEATLLQEDGLIEGENEENQPEPSPEKQKGGRNRGSVFRRFRNRGGAKKESTSTTKVDVTTAAPRRRSGFSLLGRRRAGKRNKAKEEPTEPEEAEPEPVPEEEPVDNELQAHGPQVELEVQASENVEAVVEEPAPEPEPEHEEAAEKETSDPVKEKKSKLLRPGGSSLLSRLRNRNRPQRE